MCSAAQRFLEAQLAAASDVKLIVPSSSAVLVSHSSLWPAALAKLDSVHDQLLECHDRRGFPVFTELLSQSLTENSTLLAQCRMPERDDVRPGGLLSPKPARTGARFDQDAQCGTVGNASSDGTVALRVRQSRRHVDCS